MDVSRFLGKVIGIYLVIVSLAMLTHLHQFKNDVSAMVNNESLMLVTGFFTLILGILMVVSHNIWHWNWRILVTLVSWIVLIKGASIIFFPQFIDKLTDLFLHKSFVAYVAIGFDLLLGLLLIYFGSVIKK